MGQPERLTLPTYREGKTIWGKTIQKQRQKDEGQKHGCQVLSKISTTNLIIHLLAIAGRIGVELNLEDFDRRGSKIPLLVNLMPSGKFLIEDFFYAGGLPVVIKELGDRLHQEAITVNGKTLRMLSKLPGQSVARRA